MTRSEAIKAFFFKSVLPVTVALILYCIFKSACMKNGELDYVWLWILCGLPFGLHRMCLWIVPGGGSLGGGIALFALNFIIGGVIGGFVLAWRLIVAVWYVPLTVYRLIVGQNGDNKQNNLTSLYLSGYFNVDMVFSIQKTKIKSDIIITSKDAENSIVMGRDFNGNRF